MIAIPSLTGQEGNLANHLAGMLARWGLAVEVFEIEPETLARQYPQQFFRYSFPYGERPNILGKLSGAGGGKSLMINFHLDVVDADPSTWTVDPWKGTVRDGLLLGRGAADMKGGAAAALWAVKCVMEAGVRLKGDLLIAGVIEEEGPGNGTLALQARGVRADACLIPEPTNLTIASSLTGGVYGFITIPGKSAHSTTPWVGVNAIDKSYFVIQGIENWRSQRRNLPLDPLFAHAPETRAAASITNIERSDGGNIGRVPAAVRMRIRATVMPGEDPRQVAQGVEETILAATQKDPWLTQNPPIFAWQIWGGRSYPARVSVRHPLSLSLADSFRSVTGKETEFRGFVSPADMQHLNNIQPTTPTLMFGPGSLYAAHADDEGVAIEELATASAVMADFILRWCGEA